MNMKTVCLTLLAVLFTVSAAGMGELSVSPDSFERQVFSGGMFNESLTVSWSGEVSVVVSMRDKVSGESFDVAGLNTSFSDKRFILGSGESREVVYRVDSVTGFRPDNVSFELYAVTEVPVKKVSTSDGGDGSSDGGGGGVVFGNRSNGSLNRSEEFLLRQRLRNKRDLVDKLREDLVFWRSRVESLNSTVDELRGRVEVLKEASGERDRSEGFFVGSGWVFLLVELVFAVF